MLENSFALSAEGVLKSFKADANKGLSIKQVDENRDKFGPNELPKEEGTPLWKLILNQFEDQLVQILLLAAIVSFVLAFFEEGESRFTAFVEPFVILLILTANATVGVIQESNAENAIEALRSYAPDEAKVIRNGELVKINAAEVVPGDLVEISVGDKIPADLRLIEIYGTGLRVDQAILTGESVSVQKNHLTVLKDKRSVKQDQVNMVFSGTTVTMGRARGIAVLTGGKTAIGEIQSSISEEEDEKTPLKKRLDDFGDQLAKIISVICILVWLINIRHFSDPIHGGYLRGAIYYFKIAVALAVAAIPEGLAVVITTCLALGAMKMAKKNAIVRTLPSVETLGCTSVICSDKTGTLTTNQMSVSNIYYITNERGDAVELKVEGTSFSPEEGRIVNAKDGKAVKAYEKSSIMASIAEICCLCNNSTIAFDEKTKSYQKIGEATEAALRVLVEKMGSDDSSMNTKLSKMSSKDRAQACSRVIEGRYRKRVTLDFSRDRKSMGVFCERIGEDSSKKSKKKNTATSSVLFVKGAPESILERCINVKIGEDKVVPLTGKLRQSILAKVGQYGGEEALRVLALAYVETTKSFESYDFSNPDLFVNYESEMTFVGLVAMLDPPRPEVSESIRKCHEAGIRVIVITGDNQNTAESICRKIGIFANDENLKGKSYTGREFDEMTEKEQREAVKGASLFSRTDPIHKSKLVQLLQEQGEIVAMTGDGVNDAPALKKADIGIAMGSGTDVAKLAADMVLADDNFSSIVSAVEEGRSIYNNTKQFIRYLISSNIGEVVSIFVTVLLGLPEALIPVQLLWVNLVTDGLPATALGFNPPDNAIMKEPPRSSTEPIVGRWLLIRYVIIGTFVGLATVFGYVWYFMFATGGPGITYTHLANYSKCSSAFPEIGCEMFTDWRAQKATTMSLSILVTVEMFNAMNSLSENESLLTLPIWANPTLIFAIVLSMLLHFMILYVPFFSALFSIVPLNVEEWLAVVLISLPVLVIDEVLKLVSRCCFKKISAKKTDVVVVAVAEESTVKRKKSTRKVKRS